MKKCKQVALNRIYKYSDIKNIDINYLKPNGSIGSIIYRVAGDQTRVTTEKILIESEDIYLFMYVNWDIATIVRESGSYNYAETGIKNDYVIGVNEYNFLKKLFKQYVQITGDSLITELFACGSDATPYQLPVVNTMAQLGYGYVCVTAKINLTVFAHFN